ncbi:MAG: hypothetical protein OXD44_02090 [Gammaproteobacteria bacterium]|nr:hypothetical protein [Gammaproteobacteria bacterium]
MTGLAITRHGEIRMSQRGFRKTDLEFLLAYGTEIGRDRIMLTKQDAAREIGMLKKKIANLERLSGKVLVVSGEHVCHGLPPVKFGTDQQVEISLSKKIGGKSCLKQGYGLSILILMSIN